MANLRPMRGTSLPPLLADHAAESVRRICARPRRRHDVHDARVVGRTHILVFMGGCHAHGGGQVPHGRAPDLWTPVPGGFSEELQEAARTLDRHGFVDRPRKRQLRLGARPSPVDAERGEWQHGCGPGGFVCHSTSQMRRAHVEQRWT